jgi:hypothetical protein
MFKCRHCPHVNVRKANIQEHEKRHQTKPGSAAGGGGDNMHACSMCNYRCNNAGVLSAHVKVHQNVLGIIHALADPSRSDEEQLRQVAGRILFVAFVVRKCLPSTEIGFAAGSGRRRRQRWRREKSCTFALTARPASWSRRSS